eukprot:4785157-Prymnesium_polylepis.1
MWFAVALVANAQACAHLGGTCCAMGAGGAEPRLECACGLDDCCGGFDDCAAPAGAAVHRAAAA